MRSIQYQELEASPAAWFLHVHGDCFQNNSMLGNSRLFQHTFPSSLHIDTRTRPWAVNKSNIVPVM